MADEPCKKCNGSNRDKGFEPINCSSWNIPCRACNAQPCLICDGDAGKGFCSDKCRKEWFK